MHAILKGKKYEKPVFFNSANENCKIDRENDDASFNQINELIWYQSSADFCEIGPEHYLDVVKPNCIGDFWRCSMLELDRLTKK